MEPLVHYAIPVLFMLALNPDADRKKVLRYSPLTLLPDLDFFLGHALLHSVFMPIGISSLVYQYSRKDRTAWMLSMFFLYSHIILDLGWVAILYPLGNFILSLQVNIYTSPKALSNIIKAMTGGGPGEGLEIINSDSKPVLYPLEAMGKSEISPLLTQVGLMLALLYLMTLLYRRFSRGVEGSGIGT